LNRGGRGVTCFGDGALNFYIQFKLGKISDVSRW
jgi:hypothetical protein